MQLKKTQNRPLFYGMAAMISTLFFCVGYAYSEEYSSSQYTVLDPVMNAGGYGSSTNFSLLGVISQISNGPGSSANFGDNAGFLYYPSVSSPAVSATPGSSQVSLSWTASQGYSGWAVSGYNVARSTTSGGPYTYTSLGNVTSDTQTGLVNGTTYYFVIVVKDAFARAIASSTEISAVPVAAVVPPSGGGVAGGGIITTKPPPLVPTAETAAEFSGKAYPFSKVFILKDGQIVKRSIADAEGNFVGKLTGLAAGDHSFSIYAEDKNGIHGSLFTFPVYLTKGVTTVIGGIFLAPTISVDKSEVKRGERIAIFGQAAPNAQVTININSNIFVQQRSDKDGDYLLNFDSSALELGASSVKSKQALGSEISQFSNGVGFKVGTKNVKIETSGCAEKGDLNGGCRINLVDFSIAAYWYKRPLNAAFKEVEAKYLNGDGKIDLIDFSIMAYYWSG